MIRHADSDLRDLLEPPPRWIAPDAATRIRESYPEVAHLLASCPGVSFDSALDLGCGTGNKSFALAAHFDEVVAVDVKWRNIRQARRIARRARVERIAFVRADIEGHEPGRLFDFVFANGMSHETSSRLALIDQVRGLLKPGAWLLYGELCEGYGPEGVHVAIERRDTSELRLRLHQILNGIRRRMGYRFFLAGTATRQLERLGLTVRETLTSTWNGLTTFEKTWSCAPEHAADVAEPSADADYVDASTELLELHGWYESYGAPTRALDADATAEIAQRARTDPNPLAPFLLYLPMLEHVFVTRPLGSRRRFVPRLAQPPEPDWGLLAHFDQLFIEAIRERT